MRSVNRLLKRISNILGTFSGDIGIDLGTATTLVYVRGEGIVLCEPSVAAIYKATGVPLAIGEEAKNIIRITGKVCQGIRRSQ